MPSDRYGRVKLATIRRDFDKLRAAIQSHDPERTEDAWLDCERWVDFVFARAVGEAEPSAATEGRRE